MLSRTAVDALQLKTFNDADWAGFTGCEPLADGSGPFIGKFNVAEGYALVIYDGNGMSLVFDIDLNLAELMYLAAPGEVIERLELLALLKRPPTYSVLARHLLWT